MSDWRLPSPSFHPHPVERDEPVDTFGADADDGNLHEVAAPVSVTYRFGCGLLLLVLLILLIVGLL